MPNHGLSGRASRRVQSSRKASPRPSAANSASARTESVLRREERQAASSHALVPCGESRNTGTGRSHGNPLGRTLSLALGPSCVACACAAGRIHPLLGEILAAVLIIVPLATSVILATVIVFGDSESCDRAFRLLRWIRDKKEPPAPGVAPAVEAAVSPSEDYRRPLPGRGNPSANPPKHGQRHSH